jgi:hypothetical protein
VSWCCCLGRRHGRGIAGLLERLVDAPGVTLRLPMVPAALMLTPEVVFQGRIIAGLGPVAHRGSFTSAEQ